MLDHDAITLSVPSDPACLGVVRALVGKMAEMAGFAEGQVGQIVLAVDESCTNIIRHQYDGRDDQRIDLAATVDPKEGRLEFVIRDYGQVRDASRFTSRDLGNVRPGGLGVHIIREVMDEVEYSPAQGGGMQLRLCKSAVKQ